MTENTNRVSAVKSIVHKTEQYNDGLITYDEMLASIFLISGTEKDRASKEAVAVLTSLGYNVILS